MIVNAFNDIPDNPLQDSDSLHGKDYLDNISALQVGFGARSFKSDESGIWLGANVFADAPFSVDMQGNVIASSATFSSYATTAAALLKAGTAQPLTGDIRVGTGANVKIDGANARIMINDGTNNRILIGYQSGGF